ncbi:type 1 glutamine amidotransferase domain-containing protein [Oceanobacillus sp. 1P07AA]|uniref:type 1 glutamine amidotransferase domain-containing protein n=1 Tax=Oceanobacillus sp. 1P07AA TaxID=3132293 RepID=UPI0039A7884D
MQLQNKKVLALVDHDFEDLELWYPVLRLREEGAQVDLIGKEANHQYIGKYGVPVVSDFAFTDVNDADYDAILVPGGWAPDKLRRFPEVLDMVRNMNQAKKPIGQICHAGWVLISANILNGKTVTSTPGIKDDMTNAGATWVDEPVVVDEHLVSSRRPPDLPDYLREFINVLANK